MNDLKDYIIKAIIDEIESPPDDEDSFELFEEKINELGHEYGWDNVVAETISLLLDKNHKKGWYYSVSILNWVIEDGHTLPFEWSYIVAVLYRCLELEPNLCVDEVLDAENLVWSISQTIRRVDYLSDWNPLTDPEVVKHMETLKKHTD